MILVYGLLGQTASKKLQKVGRMTVQNPIFCKNRKKL